MTVVERVRELGLLRAAGATRGQVVRIVEHPGAAARQLAGSAPGPCSGPASPVRHGVAARVRRRGAIDGPVATPSILVAGLAVGVVVTLVAALEPAHRAASMSPGRPPSGPAPTRAAAARAHVGWLIAIVVVVGVVAVDPARASATGTGSLPARRGPSSSTLCSCCSRYWSTPALLGPLGRVAGLPFAPAAAPGGAAGPRRDRRDRARTTLTVGALVVGLAMVVALGAVAANARTAATAWLGDVVPGDEVLTAIAPAPIGDDGSRRDAAIDGVRAATPIASFDLALRRVAPRCRSRSGLPTSRPTAG